MGRYCNDKDVPVLSATDLRKNDIDISQLKFTELDHGSR